MQCINKTKKCKSILKRNDKQYDVTSCRRQKLFLQSESDIYENEQGIKIFPWKKKITAVTQWLLCVKYVTNGNA